MTGPTDSPPARLWGMAAEFLAPEDLVAAAGRARSAGYRRLDGLTPYPVPGLAEAIGFHERLMAPLVLAGGLAGGLGGYALQYYTTVIAYPHNVGGRPLHSWPSFIPVTFEMTVLLAAVTGLLSLLVLNRLPRLSHPVFRIRGIERASSDRFFLYIQASDPKFSPEETSAFLRDCGAAAVSLIPEEEDEP